MSESLADALAAEAAAQVFKRQSKVGPLIVLPGGVRVALNHVISYEAGGDCGITFHAIGGTIRRWEAPKDKAALDRKKLAEVTLEFIDNQFEVHATPT